MGQVAMSIPQSILGTQRCFGALLGCPGVPARCLRCCEPVSEVHHPFLSVHGKGSSLPWHPRLGAERLGDAQGMGSVGDSRC